MVRRRVSASIDAAHSASSDQPRSSGQHSKAPPLSPRCDILKPACNEVLRLKPSPSLRAAAIHGIQKHIIGPIPQEHSLAYARRVEWKVYNAHRRSIKHYQRVVGSLIYNLSVNASYLCAAYPDPVILASLGDVELGRGTAAEEFVRKNEERERKLLEIIAGRGGLEECGKTMIRCHRKPGCMNARVDWSQLQTKGADEPITTLATCSNCGHTWNAS
jgi:DNA-directed RNA polymerase subunit M/transcription elongation factor TFIIS